MTLRNSLKLGLCLGVGLLYTSTQAQTFRHDSASSSLRPPPASTSGTSTDVYVGGASDVESDTGLTTTTTTTSVRSSAASAQEKKFVKEAISGNHHEVAMAEIAEVKAQNQELKNFAKHLREDHTAANQQLQTIAQNLGVDAVSATEVKNKHERELKKLNGFSNDEFDKEFAEMALKDHQKDIKKYQAANKFVQSAELKQYIVTTLPKLRQHLEHGLTVAQAVGVDQDTIANFRNTLDTTVDSVGGATVETTIDTDVDTGVHTDVDANHADDEKTTKGAGAKELQNDSTVGE